MIKRSIFLYAAAILLASCAAWEDHFPGVEELGLLQDEYIIPETGSSVNVEYLSNMKGTVVCDAEWILPSARVFEGDGSFEVVCPANDGFPRVGRLILLSDGAERSDTAVFRQYGTVSPEFVLESTSFVVYNSNGVTLSDVPVSTNLTTDDMEIEVFYTGDAEGWLEGVEVADGKLTLRTRDNENKKKVNKASILFKYRNGWGEQQVARLDVIQANGDNALGVVATFPELRALADGAEDGQYLVSDDLFLDAHVISDPASGNVADCPNLSTSKIDYSAG